jgi:REP element-mobilizing transposase RayT
MEKKEFYRHDLPHFQQPGQAYFVTWNLKDAIPPKALARYTIQLQMIRARLGAANSDSRGKNCDSEIAAPEFRDWKSRHPNGESEFAAPGPETEKLKRAYNLVRKQYIKAYDDLLDGDRNPSLNLSRKEITEIIIGSLQFWEGIKLKNIAYTIMPNHVHWVFELFKNDKVGNLVYLQDILQSVKRFSSYHINKIENRNGTLWQKESFDTTIRDEKHLYYAVRYTLNNPVKAGLANDWRNWAGTWNGYDGCRDF